MKLRVLVPILTASLALGACSKSEKKKGDDKTPASESKVASDPSQPSPGNEAPAPSVAKTNALWSLAPAGTVLGAVVAPGSAARLHGMMTTVLATLEARPLGATLTAKLREKSKGNPVDVLDAAAIKNAGIDLSGAAAIFMVGKKQGYVVLPISDRGALRKVTGATLETIEGLEVDKFDDDFLCAPKSDTYLCASSIANLKAFGGKVDGPLSKRVAALPNEYRGEVEFVMDLPGMKKIDSDFDTDFDGQFTNPQLAIGALRFGNGAITLRGWMQARPLDKVAAAVQVPSSLTGSLGSSHPSGLFSMRLPVSLIMEQVPANGKKVAGLDLRNDVLGNFTGEFAAYVPQSDSLWGRLDMGLKDAAPFKTLLNMGCGMAPMAGIPGIKVTPGDGKCEALIDVSKLPLPDPSLAQMFSEPVAITAEVKADRFELTFGHQAPVTDRPMSALGKEFTSKKWSFVMWGEGIGVASGPEIPWNKIPGGMPPNFVDGVQMAVWALAHIYEVGMAGAVRDDGIHGVMHVATYAGDPPEAYKAYEAAVVKVLSDGKAVEEFAAIHKKWPNTMAGRGGTGAGSMMVAGISGAMAAIAVPAFEKYMRRSREAAEEIKR